MQLHKRMMQVHIDWPETIWKRNGSEVGIWSIYVRENSHTCKHRSQKGTQGVHHSVYLWRGSLLGETLFPRASVWYQNRILFFLPTRGNPEALTNIVLIYDSYERSWKSTLSKDHLVQKLNIFWFFSISFIAIRLWEESKICNFGLALWRSWPVFLFFSFGAKS